MAVGLTKILPKALVNEVVGNPDIEVEQLTFNSRVAGANSCFFAIRGTQADGHRFIPQAVENGASAIVCEAMPVSFAPNVTYVRVSDSSEALGLMASAFYGNPSSNLKLVGVTGTNGKTTTATLLYRIVGMLGFKAGLLSTVVNQVVDEQIPTTHTTPDPIELNRLLRRMVDAGCSYCFMEVSSHAVVQKRIAGLTFAGGIFTNITHDHLDYHKTFDEYIRAKKMFFDQLPSESFALVNADDRNGMVMVQNTKAKVSTYALHSIADFRCRVVESHFDGMLLNMDGLEVWTRLIGEFNAYNLLAIYASLLLLGFDKTDVLLQLSMVNSVSGRFEYVSSSGGITAVVDYAHTPDALVNVIETIKKIKSSGQRLITVVGAGGNRDKTKRPVMARVAVQNSDLVILTSDNPRFEEPEDIINDMKAGVDEEFTKKLVTIVDRHEAIRTACLLANKEDIILVAGKGHENYQEVKGVKHHFDDKEVLAEIFNELHI
ncbi:MAG: UDP-N-acetylmuramoyl-L-alanyl-D-glutamate--2,6-diaminopimelate ligase [Bacteroidales bacterium]|nr:UDP-N-acetylmuramoyl-L-alanyl-D-glutamate--2,6-diaminopimelate ligase [Bacteroidales bacterium]HNT41127.1 UDP-N-acetylmuramoyl-L-alanyl-D-glutamate--2,6-diaminopimelate ligase [Tenuifilaceae bacterium]HOA10128.1 UDP-N-acetylmuramoyl-L-alanyl-D-glutamate--2,6-diaminopimelate ligase [Tenuifilaceae bacterium]HOC37142.1 UDP-N-acetylmuramoyl-L-alanyl-D-glutamate--2,6-diaminopimelate ligase [Tenuifilaceae bacterium]HOG72842.1 UDP-N-acetylmuramoyl-L-alanyl-D-glutamate--2,6-diaminopimelate ligase [T